MTVAVAGALRAGLPAVRRAGWRGAALALATFVPPALVALSPWPMLVVAGLIARTDLVLALIRHLGACRPEPVPPPPRAGAGDGDRDDGDEGEGSDEGGRAGGPVTRPAHWTEPVGPDDRRVRRALGAAGALLRPAIRLTGVQLLALVAARLTLVLLAGDRVAEMDARYAVLLTLPLLALGWAFLGVAGQRIALEGDPRVLVAIAHSVRVARSAYGSLLLLNLVQPALAAVALVVLDPGHPPARSLAVGGALLAASVAAQLVVTAAATELYVSGPRLDVPDDFGQRRAR